MEVVYKSKVNPRADLVYKNKAAKPKAVPKPKPKVDKSKEIGYVPKPKPKQPEKRNPVPTIEMSDDMEKCELRANRLLDSGKAFEYIHSVWCKRSKSDPLIGKALLISKGCQSATNSKGLHVQINGEAGYGKTWSIECMIGIMPEAGVWDSDLSYRALYYPTWEIKDGMVMYVVILIGVMCLAFQ